MLCVTRERTNMVIYYRIMIHVNNVFVSRIVLSGFVCLAHSYDRIHPFVMCKIGSNFYSAFIHNRFINSDFACYMCRCDVSSNKFVVFDGSISVTVDVSCIQ
jgi:acetyltransferase-like isoleucine patch superfamily enzyme